MTRKITPKTQLNARLHFLTKRHLSALAKEKDLSVTRYLEMLIAREYEKEKGT
jgi:hypothetical protein